jgi:hypothetical protein
MLLYVLIEQTPGSGQFLLAPLFRPSYFSCHTLVKLLLLINLLANPCPSNVMSHIFVLFEILRMMTVRNAVGRDAV